MKKLLKILSAAMVSAGLTTGFAAAQTGSIDTTGPDSINTITATQNNDADIDVDNDVDVDNDNDQDADSGNATVSGNTTGGDATSGDATNENTFENTVAIEN